MEWLRRNAGWITLLGALGGSLLALHVKATLAETTMEIAVLKTRNEARDKADEVRENRLDRIEEKLDRVLEALGRRP